MKILMRCAKFKCLFVLLSAVIVATFDLEDHETMARAKRGNRAYFEAWARAISAHRFSWWKNYVPDGNLQFCKSHPLQLACKFGLPNNGLDMENVSTSPAFPMTYVEDKQWDTRGYSANFSQILGRDPLNIPGTTILHK
jgi:hypothetical protein